MTRVGREKAKDTYGGEGEGKGRKGYEGAMKGELRKERMGKAIDMHVLWGREGERKEVRRMYRRERQVGYEKGRIEEPEDA